VPGVASPWAEWCARPDGYMLSIGHFARTSSAARPTSYSTICSRTSNRWRCRHDPQIWFQRPRFRQGSPGTHCLGKEEIRTKVSIGTGGAGTPGACQRVYFRNHRTQAQIIHYRGAAPAMQDLLPGTSTLLRSGRVCRAEFRAGRVKPYAVTAKRACPRRPIFRRSTRGLPGFYMPSGTPSGRPGRTPKDVVAG